jgi:type IV secretory pathway VirB9-like protein
MAPPPPPMRSNPATVMAAAPPFLSDRTIDDEPVPQSIRALRPHARTCSALNFRYEIQGDTPAWRPLRAFDDGSKVYIEFPSGVRQGEMPPLFIIGPGGDSELVNYRDRQNYYVVDRLFAAAELRLGDKNSERRVRIVRTDGRQRL